MTFDEVEAFVAELNHFDKQQFEAEMERTKMLADFAGQLFANQTKVIAAAVGMRVV